jgi:hypothetical protein
MEVSARDDIGALAQHVLHHGKLLAVVARLAATVALAIGLRVFDTSPLGFLGGLCLGLRGRGHERDQRVPDGHLHGIFSGAVEGHAVDHGLDDDATTHELADCVGDVGVVAAQAGHHRDGISHTPFLRKSPQAKELD